jgi:hypothetical protein
MTLSEERLREMLAGLDGVTPGPWQAEWPDHEQEGEERPRFVASAVTTVDDLSAVCTLNEASEADAAHIARCDPDTMREILTLALLSLRSDAHTGGEVKDERVLVPVAFIEFVKTAPVYSGVCVCGDAMGSHSPMGDHSPVDQWDHSLSLWLEQLA